MSLHGTLEQGVKPANVWDEWNRRVPDPQTLVAAAGWPAEVVATIEAYRESAAHYSFPTLHELQQHLAEYFVISDTVTPLYELGGCCPSLILHKAD